MSYENSDTCRIRLLLFILLVTVSSCDSNTQNKKVFKTISGYNFPAPKGWQTEHISFPIEFAPQIPFKGFEDLRFTPGWEFTTSEEHWSYTFLWWLEGAPKIDSDVVAESLKAYYTGLVGQNVRQRNIPATKVVPIVATIKKMAVAQGDLETYSGTVIVTDYLDLMYNSITLNCAVHKKDCGSHTALIFEISPQPLGHTVWESLNKVQADFTCAD